MYEIFEQLLQKNGITSYKVAKDTGIAQSVFSSWKNGISKPKQDKLLVIANYFNVTVDFLLGETNIVACPVCGFGNNPLSEQSEKEHEEFHERFLISKENFPPLTNYSDSQIKRLAAYRELLRKHNSEKQADLFKDILEAMYSLELQKDGYDTFNYSHKSFEDFCPDKLDEIVSETGDTDLINDETKDWLDKKYNIKYINKDKLLKEKSAYYLNDETAKIAQEIFDRDDLRILMDASRKAKPEDIQFLIAMAKRLKGEN